MESTALRIAPQNGLVDSLKARVVTKAFGLRIGAFGVDYTSKSVEVDPDQARSASAATAASAAASPSVVSADATIAPASPQAPDTRAQAFQAEMTRARLHQQLSDASSLRTGRAAQDGPPSDGASQGQDATAQAASSHPDPVWRRGLAAYAQARDLLRSDSRRLASTRLAVA